MPDRVAIIGGGTVGRDHFPTENNDTVSGALWRESQSVQINYPFVVSPQKMCRWFYLVKQWYVEIRISWNPVGGGSTTASVIQLWVRDWSFPDWDNPDDGYFIAEREAEWASIRKLGVNLSFSDVAQSFIDNSDGPPSTSQVQDYISSDINPGNSIDIAFQYGFPRWNADGLLCATEIGISWGGAIISSGVDVSGEDFGLLTVDSDVEIPLSGGDPYDEVSAVNIDIQPVEFWPYATKAGLPVYDTATGAILNDPFS